MLRQSALLLGLLVCTPAAQAGDGAAPQDASARPSPVAARGKGGTELSVEALEAVLLERFAHSADGNELLELLVKTRVLDELAAVAGLKVDDKAVSQLWDQLDRQARAAGQSEGLLNEIRRRGLTVESFREYLRLSIIQETLTRRALGLEDGTQATGTQQEIWLQQELGRRGLERYPPPWEEGLIARCGSLAVTTDEFATYLRRRLEPKEIRETAWHMLLARTLAERMPDLSQATLERATDVEMDRRRANHAREYPGISFEERLGATGRTLEILRKDPSVQIAVLTRLWVDRAWGEDGIRETYEEERAYFDGRFGRAVRTHILMLVAGRYKNDLVPRTFEEAEERLTELAARAGNAEDFESLVVQFSEEPNTRKEKGVLGWVTSQDPRFPETIPNAIFEWLGTGGEVRAGGQAVGPIRLDTGAAMLWVSALRPTPPWEEMAERVHDELRRRLVEDLLPYESVEVLQTPAR